MGGIRGVGKGGVVGVQGGFREREGGGMWNLRCKGREIRTLVGVV